jgi:5-formyltetrahydrofolate cyclo-ligase
MGRGRALYERLLPQLAGAVLIGVCAERFVVDDLPLEAHDVPMDLVVSEAAVRPGPEVVRRRDAGEPGAPT